jgi:hypothetical protein
MLREPNPAKRSVAPRNRVGNVIHAGIDDATSQRDTPALTQANDVDRLSTLDLSFRCCWRTDRTHLAFRFFLNPFFVCRKSHKMVRRDVINNNKRS